MVEEKILLELGYGLLSLVKNADSELLVAISNLRKQEPYMPKIRIIDNMSLKPSEISINNERHLLENNGNYVFQITTFITQHIKDHPETLEFEKAMN